MSKYDYIESSTPQERERHLNGMAKKYGAPPAKLIASLAAIKTAYIKYTAIYDNIPDPKAYVKQRDAIVRCARKLEYAIKTAPQYLRDDIDKKSQDAHVNAGGSDELPSYTGSIQEEMQWLIHLTEDRPLTRNVPDVTGEYQLIERKTEIHRDRLVTDLVNAWFDLTKKRVDSGGDGKVKEFLDFMAEACDYMEISRKGLDRKYTDLKTREKL